MTNHIETIVESGSVISVIDASGDMNQTLFSKMVYKPYIVNAMLDTLYEHFLTQVLLNCCTQEFQCG
jgi:hypothetical protein